MSMALCFYGKGEGFYEVLSCKVSAIIDTFPVNHSHLVKVRSELLLRYCHCHINVSSDHCLSQVSIHSLWSKKRTFLDNASFHVPFVTARCQMKRRRLGHAPAPKREKSKRRHGSYDVTFHADAKKLVWAANAGRKSASNVNMKQDKTLRLVVGIACVL